MSADAVSYFVEMVECIAIGLPAIPFALETRGQALPE